ncbi:hypothetical protein [Brachybacterium sp. UNK5269]|uniref:hypothetical protein n=1 Tax=Brachybacterium sp. UNK5269 TaxID=3408576 RepID=UPI003BB17559
MSEAEDQIASDHSRVLRGMSATGMRLMELIQRRQEEARRREADGQREAAQALRDRQEAQRNAARTIAAQGLDPQWREAASDREIATAFVYAEAYADSEPLARVAHEQLSQHVTERHQSLVEFVDANVRQEDLDRVPAPEGTPSATQQRWMDAARAEDAAERHADHLEQIDPESPETLVTESGAVTRVLDPEELERWSDQTIGSLVGEDPHTVVLAWDVTEATPARSTVLDPEVLQRWSDEAVAEVFGNNPDKVVVVPDLSEYERQHRISAHLATVGDDVASQWADLTNQYGRDRADNWLEGNLTESEMARTNKWLLWNEAQREVAEGVSIEQAMQDLAARESDLGLDLELDEPRHGAPEDLASELGEHQGKAAVATERGDIEHAGVGQFQREKDETSDLAQRDPQAANVLAITRPGRTMPAAEQVAAAAEKSKVSQRKARTPGQERTPERDLGR